MKDRFETILLLAALIASLLIVGWIVFFIKSEVARMPRRTLPSDVTSFSVVKYQGAMPACIRWRQA